MALFMKDPNRGFLATREREGDGGAKALAAWYERLRGIVLRNTEPASRSFRYMSRLIERDFPVAGKGACLAFSSTDSDEVSTDALLMLAYCLKSELESRVLLVDARFRDLDEGLTGRLGLLDLPGFAEVMAGVAPEGPGLVHATAVDGVDILPAGGLAQTGPAQADRARLARLLGDARAAYDHVLVQVGPVLKDTRSVVTVAQADATFLLARENRTFMKSLDTSRQMLLSNGVKDVRVVVTGRGG